MQLSGIRAISFDLDDTLWPFMPCLVRAEATLLAWLQANAPGTRELLGAPDALRTFREQAHAAHPELHTDLSGLRRASIHAILVAGGEDTALVAPAFEVFFEERLRVDLYPDVAAALEQLSARFPLVALSNGNGCVQRAGVAHHFRGSLNPSTMGVAKPQAEAFHAAAALAGVKTSELLHVGDDWRFDVLGALDAGAHAAWLVREAEMAERAGAGEDAAQRAHLRIADLTVLCEALAHG